MGTSERHSMFLSFSLLRASVVDFKNGSKPLVKCCAALKPPSMREQPLLSLFHPAPHHQGTPTALFFLSPSAQPLSGWAEVVTPPVLSHVWVWAKRYDWPTLQRWVQAIDRGMCRLQIASLLQTEQQRWRPPDHTTLLISRLRPSGPPCLEACGWAQKWWFNQIWCLCHTYLPFRTALKNDSRQVAKHEFSARTHSFLKCVMMPEWAIRKKSCNSSSKRQSMRPNI